MLAQAEPVEVEVAVPAADQAQDLKLAAVVAELVYRIRARVALEERAV